MSRWVLVCDGELRDRVERVINVLGVFIVIPFSNSQAHRIYNKHNTLGWFAGESSIVCDKYIAGDLDTVVELAVFATKYLRQQGYREVEELSINDPILAVIPDTTIEQHGDVTVEYTSTDEGDIYYFQKKNSDDYIAVLV